MNEVVVNSIKTAEEFSEKLVEASSILNSLLIEVTELQKISTPVYDHYKPFKEVSTGKSFAFCNYIYQKYEVINLLGNNVNALNKNTNRFEYISDYDWVVELD